MRAAEIPAIPFRGIHPFRYVDHAIFFAREEETHQLMSLVTVYRGVMLYGDSGSGKSSVLNAGLMPEAIRLGFAPERVRLQPRSSEELVLEPIVATDDGVALPSVLTLGEETSSRTVLSIEAFKQRVLAACERHRLLLIFDQFEELVTLFDEAGAREVQRRLVDLLAEMLHGALPVKILLSFREDYLGKVKELLSECPELIDQALRLAPPAAEALPIIIRGPFERYPGHFDREISPIVAQQLVTVLAERFRAAEISLSEVQTVCLRLWQSGDPAALLAEKGPQGLLEDYLGEALASLPAQLRPAAIALLGQMVTSAGTRNVISAADLISRVRSEESELSPARIEDALERLSQSRLVRGERRRDLYLYEITSEFLVPWISRRRAEFRRQQDRHREHRRLLILGSIAGALLVLVALVAVLAGWALAERNNAQREKRVAVSGELSLQSEALSPDQVDRSLLLSLDAIATDRSARSLGALLSALNTNTSIVRLVSFGNPIRGMAIEPGTDILAVVDTTGAVRFVDSTTGRVTRVIQVRLDVPGDEVEGLTFSPDGALMALSTAEGGLQQFDTRTGRPVDTPPSGHARGVIIRAVRYSPDGRWLVTGGTDGKIIMMDRQTGRTWVLGHHNDWVNSVVFTPDSRFLFSGGGKSMHKSRDNRVLLWDLHTRRLVRVYRGARDAIRSIALSPDGRDIAAGCADGSIRVWNRATGRQLWEHTAGSDRVFSVRYATDGEYLASAGRDGLVRFWDPATGSKWAPPIHAHEGAAAGLAILPGQLLASGGEDGRVVIVLPSRTRLNRLGTHVGDSETAPAVAVDPSSGTTAVGYNNGLVVLRANSGTVLGKPLDTGDRTGVAGLAFAPGQRLVTTSYDGRLEVWDTHTHARLAGPVKVDHRDAVAVSPDGSVVATGGDGGRIRLWTMQLQPVGPTLSGQTGQISGLAFASNTTLISAGYDKTIWEWTTIGHDGDRSNPQGHRLTAAGEGAAFTSVTVSPDGQQVVAGDSDGKILFFGKKDVNAHPNDQLTVTNSTRGVTFVGYTHDRQMLVSADSAGVVRLWLLTPEPQPVGVLGRVGAIQQAALAPDGRTLITVGEGGETIWHLDTSSWVRLACTIAGRNLTPKERRLFEQPGTRHAVCSTSPSHTASRGTPSPGR